MTEDYNAFRAGLIYSLLSATCYGFLAILFKLGYLVNLNTGTMLTFRFISAFIFLTPYIYFTKRKKIFLKPAAIFMAAICGIFFYGAQSYCFAASLRYISAATAGLILYLYPLVVMLVAAFLFKNRITKAKVFSIIFILCGCMLVFYDAFFRLMEPKGLFLAVAAMLSFSSYFIFLQKSLINVDSTVFSYYVIGFTALQCIVVYHPFNEMILSPRQIIICLLLGLIPTVFAIVLLFKAIERIGSSYAAIFSSVEPAVTLLAAAFLLQERIDPLQVGGMVCIISGIIIPNLGKILEKKRPAALA